MGMEERVLDAVNRRTATLADRQHRPELATQTSDQDLLKSAFDQGTKHIAFKAGVIKDEYGPTTDDTGAAILQDNMDPTTGIADELVPVELEVALEYWTLHEWFGSIGQVELAIFYKDKYESEMATFRFGMGRQGRASIPRRPM